MKKRSMSRRNTGWLGVSAIFGALIFACANPNQPPGGPPDTTAPKILRITPASGTVGAKPKAVAFQFDEVVSETPKGAQSLGTLVFISPRSGDPEVEWRRSQIDVKPRDGWKPNTVYTVLLGAGVMDLRNNSIDTATRVVFSTGGPIPNTKITGVVFDWQVGRFAPKAIIEALTFRQLPSTNKKLVIDTTFYQTVADSLGRYSLDHVPPGEYVVRAIVDRNTNRLLEPLEPWDTLTVALAGNYNNDFYAFSHDTLGLKLSTATPLDSNKSIRVAFNKPVSPQQVLNQSNFLLLKVVKNDTTTININTVFSAPQKAQFDSLLRKARDDSMAKAAPPPDTSLAARTRRDSVARAKVRDSLNAIERQKIEERRQLALRGGRPLPPKDTTPQPKMKRPPLYTDVYITPQTPLDEDAQYVILARNVRSVSGYVKPDRPLPFKSLPKPKPPEDKKPNGKDTTATTTVPVKR